ncbi:MAG: dephospho-CoA kinase, partial [Actinobacteria bacterium]|nr:dephospho-CoA kinase [Actinomycetota bacterium]
VAELFAKHGAHVVDADDLARKALEPDSPLIPVVAQRFGDAVFVNGVVNRQRLAEIVFHDDQALRDLEAMIHPEVARQLQEIYQSLPDGRILVYAIPLLAEIGIKDKFDQVVVVTCELEVRKNRLLGRGMSEADIEARLAAQATDAQRNALADYLIDNSGSLSDLEQQVADVWSKLTAYA